MRRFPQEDMRNPTLSVLTYTGAVIALAVFFSPSQTQASASFTRGDAYPFVSGITLRSGGEIIGVSTKTNKDVYVVLSIDPGPSGGGITYLQGYENYLFSSNGTFTFEFRNSPGDTGSSTVTIDNIDRTPPEITINSYSTTTTNADITVSATTNEGTLNASSTVFTQNGSYDFVATDEAGNVSTSTITITTIDKTLPVITLTGEASLTMRVNGTFVDEGATVTDNVDATTTAQVSGSVTANAVGTYTLTYTYTDKAGNIAVPVTRTVDVVRGGSSGGGGGSRTIAQATSLPTIGRVLGASIYSFTRDLSIRDTGEDVTALQERLITEGFLTGEATGYFGVYTQAALKAYQAAHGIRQTGVMGPLTRQSLGSGEPVATTTAADLMAKIALLMAQIQALQALLAQKGA